VSAGALVARMNFAVDLANGRLPGITLPRPRDPRVAIEAVTMTDTLDGELSDATRATVAKAPTAAQALALVIGSPEFQRQ
jgi:uncharacterized protein (DUF1800 family)